MSSEWPSWGGLRPPNPPPCAQLKKPGGAGRRCTAQLGGWAPQPPRRARIGFWRWRGHLTLSTWENHSTLSGEHEGSLAFWDTTKDHTQLHASRTPTSPGDSRGKVTSTYLKALAPPCPGLLTGTAGCTSGAGCAVALGK